MLCGCLEWQQRGMMPPDRVLAATQEYRDEEDALAVFIRERCVTGSEHTGKASVLYAAFKRWQEAAGERDIMKQRRFGQSLASHGFVSRQSGCTVYDGIDVQQMSAFIDD
jgi:phage/plasmid-associated DNA primase